MGRDWHRASTAEAARTLVSGACPCGLHPGLFCPSPGASTGTLHSYRSATACFCKASAQAACTACSELWEATLEPSISISVGRHAYCFLQLESFWRPFYYALALPTLCDALKDYRSTTAHTTRKRVRRVDNQAILYRTIFNPIRTLVGTLV